ncbi:MAG: hypothetical protein AAF517_12075, partial [Planctomycetota bacterium]
MLRVVERSSVLVLVVLVGSALPRVWASEAMEAQLDRAQELRRAGDLKECLRVLRKVATKRVESRKLASLAQCRIGEVLLLRAKPELAEKELKRVRREFPLQKDTASWADLALIDAYKFQGRADEALQVFSRMESDYAKKDCVALAYAWALSKVGRIHRRAGRKSQAIELLKKAGALDLQDPGPKLQSGVTLCDLLIEEGKLREAADQLKALQLLAGSKYPKQANWARVRRAQALTHSWQYDEAIRVADEIISGPGSSDASSTQRAHAHLWKARALEAKKDYRAAVDSLKNVEGLDRFPPDMAFDILFKRAELCRHWCDYEGRPIFPAPKKSPKELEEARKLRARLRLRAQRYYRDALAFAEKSKVGESELDRARLHVGGLAQESGQRDEAIATLRLGIVDPSRLSASDEKLARRILDFLPKRKERERWIRFLLRPQAFVDPTLTYLRKARIRQKPAKATHAKGSHPYRRYVWLAE